MMVKGARNGFEATFRVVAYGYSANIFLVVPFCGGLLAGVWAIILYIIGLREAHETTGGKAALAVFLPVVVCCATYMLAHFVNVITAALALSGFYFYVFIYTRWLKRSSPQNIVIGGAAGAFPPLVGWAAVTGRIELA